MSTPPEPIAVVGVGCRFPGGCNTPSKLWDLVCEQRDIQSKIPTERYNSDAFHHEDGSKPGCTNVSHGYFLDEDIRAFDAAFFRMNPAEIEAVDPQQRMLLETVYEALEFAGITMDQLRGTDTAVYVGCMTSDYTEMLLRDPLDFPKYMAPGTARSILSNRISYFYDWHGPSMSIDTACSASLVAIHEAVQALRSGVSRVACAAGSNAILGPENFIIESKLQLLSPTGRSRMWDAAADGYARGEGAAALIMKKLSHALADGDEVYCIIRETGVNSDGRTNGITMPSAEAQAALIRQTYARACLDPLKDGCQYFEAHGTGTQAGDPQEARAIHEVFFPETRDTAEVLYVGSVKTVIGHLEGAAGVAGLIKAAEAVRRAIVPPNMLLQKLNPAIEPFCKNLKVPTQSSPWPHLSPDAPRRASVNSFGFGGTNAHAIIESYESHPVIVKGSPIHDLPPSPVLLSANSDLSLRAQATALADFLECNESIPWNDLLYTLQSKRSQHSVRTAVSATSREDLLRKIRATAQSNGTVSTSTSMTQPSSSFRFLGVFTGQGAQWATMGSELLRTSLTAQQCFERLDTSLSSLPDAPDWTLSDQCRAGSDTSRLGEAAIAQPLCTAVQIMVVDLLKEAGVNLVSVVGHSSGEIAAAYAVGAISAHDAIRIAYYRGLYAPIARSQNGQKGAMMAVGLSYEEACELCEGEFAGRVDVAAWNSDTSSTLSGDEDAILEIKARLEDGDVFARLLKVDTAYHSHHMVACSGAYTKALRACSIKPHRPRRGSAWFSSVYGGRVQGDHLISKLSCEYWVDNLLSPVMFHDAIETVAYGDLLCNAAIEIGPHPALKTPVTQTYQRTINHQLFYYGTLLRGRNDVEALSETLGSLWIQLGSNAVDFAQYNQTFFGTNPRPRLVRLPGYMWDHSRQFWKEGRKSLMYRTQNEKSHPLLGKRAVDDLDEEKRWENYLRLQDLPWLFGHVVQGQVVYPAAAYLVMALAASRTLVSPEQVAFYELFDVTIEAAILLGENDANVQTLFTLNTVTVKDDEPHFQAEWTCRSASGEDSRAKWRVNAKGKVRVLLNSEHDEKLPPRITPAQSLLTSVSSERLYDNIEGLGLSYSGLFRRLEDVKRRSKYATATLTGLDTTDPIHPAILDSTFQPLIAAMAYPGDGSMTSACVPTHIGRIRIAGSQQMAKSGRRLIVDTFATASSARSFTGDVDLYDAESGDALMQVESITCTTLSQPGPNDYKELYTQDVWELDIGSGVTIDQNGRRDKPEELDLLIFQERLAYSYLRRFYETFSKTEVSLMEPYFTKIFEWLDKLLPLIAAGRHPTVKADWAEDDHEVLLQEASKLPDRPELTLLQAVGEHFASVARGETTMLEHMIKDNMLERTYTEMVGVPYLTSSIGKVAHQIAHRYPRMNILEIGAGTGSFTSGILQGLGSTFDAYTYTDISSGFFESAGKRFQEWSHKMVFRQLNIEGDVELQGYRHNDYDMVVAANVLHATKSVSQTLNNVRQLLRPGGYLLLVEWTGDNLGRFMTYAGLPGFWLSEDGRHDGPTLSKSEWDQHLQQAGFSEIDTWIPDMADASKHLSSLMVVQAVDRDINIMRYPLTANANPLTGHAITIVGGHTTGLDKSIKDLLTSSSPGPDIHLVDSLAELADEEVLPASLICLEDLDRPILQDLTEATLLALQRILPNCRHIVWVGHEGRFANLSMGLCRSLANEYGHVALQFLKVHDPSDLKLSRPIAESMVRIIYSSICSHAPSWLWSSEPELAIDQHIRLSIPRVFPDTVLNDRFNANTLSIKKSVQLNSQAVTIKCAHDAFEISKVDITERPHIRITYALLQPINISGDSYFVSYGGAAHREDDIRVVLSPTCSSSVPISKDYTVAVSHHANAASHLPIIASRMLVQRFLQNLNTNRRLAINEPDEILGAELLRAAAERGIKTVCFSSQGKPGCTSLHALATNRVLNNALPRDVATFLDFAPDQTDRWARVLPARCTYFTVEDLWKSELSFEDFASITTKVFHEDLPGVEIADLIPVSDVSSITPGDVSYSSVVDFSAAIHINALLPPTDYSQVVRDDGTYFMVGCAGGLGRAVCSWLVDQGARYLALVSRNVLSIDKAWLSEIEGKGAKVQLCQADVADMDSLSSVLAKLRADMPPIAGVVHAAMVLKDKAFGGCNVDDFATVFGPKVKGTLNLHSLFIDEPLDFFIMFSSIASLLGSPGQSNYAASNLCMTAVAAERRARGLSASVIHIGAVTGLGYVLNSDIERKLLTNYDTPMPISETAFLDIFAQSILIGRPDSGHSPEVITGVPRYNRDTVSESKYGTNPRLSHHIVEQTTSRTEASATAVSVRQSVDDALSQEEAALIIQRAFCAKMEKTLQMPADAIDCAQPLMNLGVDSLIAVEIRSWFLKQLDVSLPVLKILGGSSVGDICYEAASKAFTASSKARLDSTGHEIPVSPPTTFLRTPSDKQDDSGSELREDVQSSPPSSVSQDSDTERTDREGPLGYEQKKIWSAVETYRDPALCNLAVIFKIAGQLDLIKLEQAGQQVVQRHEILRTKFEQDTSTGEVTQYVMAHKSTRLSVDPTMTPQAAFEVVRSHVFDLSAGETMKAIAVPNEGHVFLAIAWHHLVFDGFSPVPFLRDLNIAYFGGTLPRLKYQYLDFVHDQLQKVSQVQDSLAYWTSEYRHLPSTLPLFPFAKTKVRPTISSQRPKPRPTVEKTLSAHLCAAIRSVSRNVGATPFHVYLAGLQALFYSMLSVQDVCIAIQVNNREAESDDNIGEFGDLLPIKFQPQDDFAQQVRHTRDKLQAGLHANIPRQLIMAALEGTELHRHGSLYQVSVNYMPSPVQDITLGGHKAELLNYNRVGAYDRDLDLELQDVGNGRMLLVLRGRQDLYDESGIQTLLTVYERILSLLVEDTSRSVSELPISSTPGDDLSLRG
ncbi:Polyketide synthase-nonribosomal peptide synthetase [Cercospora beticola]|uniref:Polyketide synthase-nonribosomal peptide synthetase n=1 Tax=Cercospora beticola TaxID=122368 RepID=A0A2G5I0W5_CERBT|nr:Polyketide synthase-nonribosomal peptide synthetase [Cercospora beticola]PIA98429.1 Polyketide synthase-nonribosomal peptide synthetase [Cercospora beticola]